MTVVCMFVLCVQMMILSMILHQTCTISVDILLKDDSSLPCREPVVCSESFGNETSVTNLTWVLLPKDQFAAAKTVRLLQGKVVFILSLSPCRRRHLSAQRVRRSLCYLNCSEILSHEMPMFIQSIFEPLRPKIQTVVNNIGNGDNDIDTIVGSIHSILAHEKWTSYTVVSSTKEVLTAISSGLPPKSKLLFTLDEGEDLNQRLDDTYRIVIEENLNFVVICSTRCILKLLHQAHLLESEKLKRSRWLVVPDDERIEDIVQTQSHIKTTDVVILELSQCLHHYPVLSFADLKYQISFLDNQEEDTCYKHNRDFIQQISRIYDTKVIANALLMFPTPGGTAFQSRGYVRQNRDVILTDDLFPEMKYGFNNRTLIAAVLEWPPYVYKKVENGSAFYSGVSIDLLKELGLRLNFSYEITEPADQQWGHLSDGHWTGLVGLLAEKKVDFVVAPIAVDTYREEVMDFTVPFFYVQSTVLLNKPDPNTTKWKTLISPYRYEVHVCVLFSLIFCTALLFVIEEMNPGNFWTETRWSDRRRRCGDILWYHFGALMANGGAYLPHTNSGRTILTCWWLFTVISAATYSGNLIAFLTDWREKPPFSTLTEMVAQDTYHWGTLGGGVVVSLLQYSNRSEYKKIWNGIQADVKNDPDVLNADNDVHMQKVLAGGYAFISDEAVMELWQAEHCDLLSLKEEFFLLIYAVGLPKNSIYTDIFSQQVLRIYESGLVDMWLKHWMPKNTCETTITSKRVDILALQSAFYAAGVGVLLALAVLLTEYTYNRIYLQRVLNEPITDCNSEPQSIS